MEKNNKIFFILYFIKRYWTLLKFALVGVGSTILDAGFLYLFYDVFHLPLFISVVVSFCIALFNSFLRNKHRTFSNTSVCYKRQFVKFFFVATGGLFLTLICMYILIDLIQVYYLFAKLLTSLLVMIRNFLLNKYRTFKIKIKTNIFEKSQFNLDLSVIIPAYNEEKRLPTTLQKISKFLDSKKINYEILVVDDGSKDNTCWILQNFRSYKSIKLIKNGKNKGKGYSVKNGVMHAEGKYILFTDADNSTPIEELYQLMKYIEIYPIVIGSRYCEGSRLQISQGKLRLLIGRIWNFLIKMFLIDGIADTQCGFKLFQYQVAKKIFSLQKINRFGFDMEILLAAKSLWYPIKEVPVIWYNSEDSRVRPFRDAFKTFMELLFIKINYWFDGYK